MFMLERILNGVIRKLVLMIFSINPRIKIFKMNLKKTSI
jgi:hypothetical protein